MGPQALNIEGISCFFNEIFMLYSWYFFREKPMKIRPLKSPEKPVKNM